MEKTEKKTKKSSRKLISTILLIVILANAIYINALNVQASIVSGYVDGAISAIRTIQQKYPVGSTFNNADGVGGIQCKSFAGYVYQRMFGLTLPGYPENKKYVLCHNNNIQVVGEISGRPSVAQPQDMFGRAGTGDIIQGQKQSSQHTMVFMYTTDTGIHVYDCNSDGRNTVKERDLSYSEIAGSGYYKVIFMVYQFMQLLIIHGLLSTIPKVF